MICILRSHNTCTLFSCRGILEVERQRGDILIMYVSHVRTGDSFKREVTVCKRDISVTFCLLQKPS